MTTIRVSNHKKNDDCVIIVDDDGSGVSINDIKTIVFQGLWEHTGLKAPSFP